MRHPHTHSYGSLRIGETSRSAEAALAVSDSIAKAADRLIEEVPTFFTALRAGKQDGAAKKAA